MTTSNEQYSLIFTLHPRYLFAELKSDIITIGMIHDYVSELVAKSDETGKDHILLVRDIPVVLSQGEVFHTVSESLNALRGKKLALVNPYAAIGPDLEFGMTVGKNRGGDYATFNNIADAEAWLLS